MIKSQGAPIRLPRSAAGAELTIPDHPGGRLVGPHVVTSAADAPRVLLNWLRSFLQRRGDRWFAMNDAEADWQGWQTTRIHGGLGRRYRDPRFDALAECARCRGAGLIADAACVPCSATARVTIRGVS
jgi:hypothetical protein